MAGYRLALKPKSHKSPLGDVHLLIYPHPSLCCRMDLAHGPGLHHHAPGPHGGAELHDGQQFAVIPAVREGGPPGDEHREAQRHAVRQRPGGDAHRHKDSEGHHRPREPHHISQQEYR